MWFWIIWIFDSALIHSTINGSAGNIVLKEGTQIWDVEVGSLLDDERKMCRKTIHKIIRKWKGYNIKISESLKELLCWIYLFFRFFIWWDWRCFVSLFCFFSMHVLITRFIPSNAVTWNLLQSCRFCKNSQRWRIYIYVTFALLYPVCLMFRRKYMKWWRWDGVPSKTINVPTGRPVPCAIPCYNLRRLKKYHTYSNL